MQQRRSLPHLFEDRIAAEKAKLESQAALLPHGPDKERLLTKIRQLNTAYDMNEWLTSPGLLPTSQCPAAWLNPFTIES